MPYCSYFGIAEDHIEILNFLYSTKECDIYEAYSDFEKPLRKFTNTNEILGEFSRTYENGKKRHSVLLQIFIKNSGYPFKLQKIKLDPKVCKGVKHRFCATGWGLIQLYLCNLVDSKLELSHTDHNTIKSAEKWYPFQKELGKPSNWDFKKITVFSSKLNQQIRKKKVGKLGSNIVLAGALKAWDEGYFLKPYDQKKHKMERF